MFSRLLFGKTKERVECYLQGSIIFTAAAFCCDSAVCGKTAAKSERQLWFLSLPYIFPSLPTIYFPYNLSSEHGLNCLLLATYLQPAKMAPVTRVPWYHGTMVPKQYGISKNGEPREPCWKVRKHNLSMASSINNSLKADYENLPAVLDELICLTRMTCSAGPRCPVIAMHWFWIQLEVAQQSILDSVEYGHRGLLGLSLPLRKQASLICSLFSKRKSINNKKFSTRAYRSSSSGQRLQSFIGSRVLVFLQEPCLFS